MSEQVTRPSVPVPVRSLVLLTCGGRHAALPDRPRMPPSFPPLPQRTPALGHSPTTDATLVPPSSLPGGMRRPIVVSPCCLVHGSGIRHWLHRSESLMHVSDLALGVQRLKPGWELSRFSISSSG